MSISFAPRRWWSATSGLPALDHDPEGLRDRARELLSRPPYRDTDDGMLAELLQRVRETVARFLQTVLDAIAAEVTVAWGIVVLGVLLLGLVVWRGTRGWSADRTVTEVPQPRPGRTAAAWLRESDEHAAGGRWREAVRSRYAGLVSTLLEAGILGELPGRTVGELDREVAASAPTIAAAVRAAGERFEDVWYGQVPARAADLQAIDAAIDAARSTAARRSEVRA